MYRRRWGRRTFAFSCVLAALAAGAVPDAYAQPEPSAPAEAVESEGPLLDDALSALFTPDGKLAGGYDDSGPLSGGVRRSAPPPPAPTAEQLRALRELQREAESYRKEAKDFRDTITRIVKQHYEERRRRMLAGLDREISTERDALLAARNEAIRRLEDFIARYSGKQSQPEATPDAMYRLAALYDERARDTADSDLSPGLKPAIALYKRIIREYPTYPELAGVYYYLGHALNDSNRLPEAQQVWRGLACHNHYPYPVPTDPKDPDLDLVRDVPQDHEPDYWIGWNHRFPSYESLEEIRGGKAPRARARTKGSAEPMEVTYADPFPPTCVAVAQPASEGEDPRYLAEVWWKIGDWYFDELDPKAGPYSLNRAVSAYKKSMEAASREKGVLYGVSMYKLAWTYYKQQRYETATRQFVELLRYTDDVEKKTGDPGADFRSEAYTYIAGSLTYVDITGPGSEDPYIPRADVLDLVSDPLVVEQKMHIAIDRVQDPNLIPQDQKWTPEIYKAVALEFKELNQLHNRIDIAELILKKWPMDPEAPVVQAGVADTYDELARLSREGTAERAFNARQALEARTKLAAYVGNTPWVNANRDNPEALEIAERLVRGGLQRAAAEHTNLARAFMQRANETGAGPERRDNLNSALQEYRLAERAWASYLAQDENAPDSYETRFWLADARHWIVYAKVAMGEPLAASDVLKARKASADVRDSNEDDRRLEPAAFYTVNLGFLVADDRRRAFRDTNGAMGLNEREELVFEGEGKSRKVVSQPLPPAVRFRNLSQEEYLRAVPKELDVNKRGEMFRFQIADAFFLYGQFEEARSRFRPIYEEQCGKSDYGYRAWERLLTMSNVEGNIDESRALAEAQKAKSCAVSEEQKTAEALLINPTLALAAYVDARKAFEKAQKMQPGPERDDMWRKAAALYRGALENAPARDEAPEAAMNGAYAYKQVGDYDKAIGMYELFIGRYGDEKTLAGLQKGDPKAQPPIEADQERYRQRVGYLKQAYEALSEAYVLFFNYRKAAEEYDTISRVEHFEQADRRKAARNALMLYSNMGERAKMRELRERFDKLGAPPQDRAEAEFIVAKAEMNEWDPRGRDEGANQAARLRASIAMTRYYDGNRNNNAAARWVVQAAHHVAQMKRVSAERGAEEWHKKTIDAFQRYRAVAPTEGGRNQALGSPEAAMAAEAEYTLLDREIREKFDYDTGHHRYKGTTVEVISAYRGDAGEAKRYHDRLQKVVDTYLSPEWAVAARSRQGSLYDSLRTGLYNARDPALKLFSDQEEKLLQKLEASDSPDHQDKAFQFRENRQETWRATRDRELTDADKVMVTRYVESVALARRYNLSNPAVDRAVERLAFFTEVLGDEKLREYSQGIEGFTYADRMFLRTRPGIIQSPDIEPIPKPLPVVAK